ncbi:MAG TPA: hypothetical protein VK518_10550, partial [Puia sp.]|nr:hypothetical protein [Puia sp.]
MIKRLLILVLFFGGAVFAARPQLSPGQMIRGGAQSDTLPQGRRDSLPAGRPDTVPPPAISRVSGGIDTIPLTDSLKKTIDSVRRYQDSLKKADTVLSAAAMLRQIDS